MSHFVGDIASEAFELKNYFTKHEFSTRGLDCGLLLRNQPLPTNKIRSLERRKCFGEIDICLRPPNSEDPSRF
jgi:hypothetical protein